jgi:hypothetical protein
MLINILIRTSYRPAGFARALKSVLEQTHRQIRIIVSYDNHNALKYIPETVEKIRVQRGGGKYFYDDYCNQLKELVTEGYFIFLDDDDMLAHPGILQEVAERIEPQGCLVQLKRGSHICPLSADFSAGKIGMPCLILHHSLKNIADITTAGAGDYVWIKKVSEQIQLTLLPLIVVLSDRRGNGKQEKPLR